jgi:recombination protein RecR
MGVRGKALFSKRVSPGLSFKNNKERPMKFPDSVENLIKRFSKLPGIGKKSAERFVFFLLGDRQALQQLGESINDLDLKIHQCAICGNIAEEEQCPICTDAKRDQSTLCVVENFKDLYAMEASQQYRGRYHILMGLISPLEGKGPEKLRMNELVERVKNDNISEVVLATSSSTEGDTTCLYIDSLLKPLGVKVTRLAFGLAVGSDIAHADQTTLGRALEGRQTL